MTFQKINEKPSVINDYEAGRAIPNNQIMSKIERAIGICNINFDLWIVDLLIHYLCSV